MPEWSELEKFQTEFRAFVAEHEWDQFHTPKNLAMALSGKVGELLEHFQWLTPEQSADLPDETLAEIAQEIADVQIYLPGHFPSPACGGGSGWGHSHGRVIPYDLDSR